MTRFNLQPHVDALLAKTSEWNSQAETRSALKRTDRLGQLLGLANRPSVPVNAVRLQAADCGSYVEEKYSLDVGEGVQAPNVFAHPQI